MIGMSYDTNHAFNVKVKVKVKASIGIQSVYSLYNT